MQIHDLNTFSGTPGITDYLAIDTGFDTAKISADKLLAIKVDQPRDEYNQPDPGEAGQLLRSKGDGSTEWSDVGLPTDAQTAQAVSDWLDAHPEATTTVQDHSLDSDKLIVGTLGYVSYKMFGATGDGVTDDFPSIANCHNYANANNLPVINFDGSYYIGSHDAAIALKTSLIFKAGGFVFDSQSFNGNTSYLFRCETESYDADFTGILSDVFSDAGTVKAAFTNKTFTLRFTDNDMIFNNNEEFRVGFTAHANYRTCLFPLADYSALASKNVSVTFIHNEDTPIYIGGFRIDYTHTKYRGLIYIGHDNVTIQDVHIYVSGINTDPDGTLIYWQNSYNNRIINVSCFDTLATTNVYGYLFEFSGVHKTVIDSLCSVMPWRAIGTRYIYDFKMVNCDTERFDCHFMQLGEVIIENCIFSKMTEIGYGFGKTVFENCTFEYKYAMIYRYTPSTCVYYGDIYIKNSRAKERLAYFEEVVGDKNNVLTGYLKTYNGKGDLYIDNCEVPYPVWSLNARYTYYTRNPKIVISNCNDFTLTSSEEAKGADVKCINCNNVLGEYQSGHVYFVNCQNVELHNFRSNVLLRGCSFKETTGACRAIIVAYDSIIKTLLSTYGAYGDRVFYNCDGVVPISGNGIFVDGGHFTSKAGYSNTGKGVIQNCYCNGATADEIEANTRITHNNILRAAGTVMTAAAGSEAYTFPDLTWIDTYF